MQKAPGQRRLLRFSRSQWTESFLVLLQLLARLERDPQRLAVFTAGHLAVRAMAQDFQVLDAVVMPDVIDVMHVLVTREKATERLFDHPAVLENPASAHCARVIRFEDPDVSLLVNERGLVLVHPAEGSAIVCRPHAFARAELGVGL